MGYREVYTAVNMADEEYNISDKGLSITPTKNTIFRIRD